ncbi:MAG: hypothetical protein M3Q44_07170 [bacterium]|nr:hypothetical protein [bacterium]
MHLSAVVKMPLVIAIFFLSACRSVPVISPTPVPSLDPNRYIEIVTNKDATLRLYRDMKPDRIDTSDTRNVYFVTNPKDGILSDKIFSNASADEIVYDPLNEGFVFVDMSWEDQFTLRKISVIYYDLGSLNERTIYITNANFKGRGPCYIGSLTSQPKSITLSTSKEEHNCFTGDPNYKDNAVTFNL